MNLHTFFFGALTGLGVGAAVVGCIAVHAIDRLRAQLAQYQDGYRHAVARARVLERKAAKP
jgi:hypothetical protein